MFAPARRRNIEMDVVAVHAEPVQRREMSDRIGLLGMQYHLGFAGRTGSEIHQHLSISRCGTIDDKLCLGVIGVVISVSAWLGRVSGDDQPKRGNIDAVVGEMVKFVNILLVGEDPLYPGSLNA